MAEKVEVLNSQLETANLDLKEKQKQIDSNDADKRDLNLTIEKLQKKSREDDLKIAELEMRLEYLEKEKNGNISKPVEVPKHI